MEHCHFNPSFPEKIHHNMMVDALKSGKVIIHPADTCYGLACRADNPEAIAKISAIKNRPGDKFYSMAVSDMAMFAKYGNIPEADKDFLKRHLPGRFTIITKSTAHTPDHLRHPNGTIGIRIPKLESMLRVIQAVGVPIITTSANISGESTVFDPDVILSTNYDTHPDILFDGGKLQERPSSTLIDITSPNKTILREGSGIIEKHHTNNIRMCIGTRERHPKEKLIRITKSKENTIHINSNIPGKSMYILPNTEAFKKAFGKKNPCGHFLGLPCSSDIVDQIEKLCS